MQRWLQRALTAIGLSALVACAASNKAAVYTENGLRAGEQAWDAYYREEAARCEKLHEPQTPEMETCFGATYDADAAVATAIESAVALLRTYWLARAAGQEPDPSWTEIMAEVEQILRDLPPEALEFFQRVRGIR